MILTPIAEAVSASMTEWWWRACITSLPLLIAVMIYLIASYKKCRWLSLSEIYVVYSGHELKRETNETISEREPSVTEFQDWMEDLSGELKRKKLVVIFDNMDRLPSNKVGELWSSIHTFFSERQFSGIWVIVPFDRKHLLETIEKEKSDPEEFIRKSFSVVYRVAPPVLTDWRKFFDLKFEEAFRELERDELEITKRIFDRLNVDITPRSIISFINEIVSLRHVVDQSVKLRYISIFTLQKNSILKSPVDQILSGGYLQDAAQLFLHDSELPDNIAALTYNVPLHLASQVTLGREIQRALNMNRTERLNDLVTHPHFQDILEKVVGAGDFDANNGTLSLAGLEESCANAELEGVMQSVWDDLCAQVVSMGSETQEFTEVHRILLTCCSNSTKKGLVGHLVQQFQGSRDVEFSATRYHSSLSQLSAFVLEEDIDIDISSLIRERKSSASTFIEYLQVAKETYKTFKLTCEQTELNSYISERIPSNLKNLSCLSFVSDEYDFTEIVQQLEVAIENATVAHKDIGAVYALYRAVAKKKPIKVLDSSVVENLLQQTTENSDSWLDLIAMRIAAGPDHRGYYAESHSILNNTDGDLVERLAARIEFYKIFGDLLVMNVGWSQPILTAILRRLVAKSYGTSRLNIVTILENYGEIISSLGVSPSAFIRRLNAWNSYAKERIHVDNIMDVVTDHVLFEHSVKTKCSLTRHLIDTMVKVLSSLGANEWRKVLRNEESFQFRVTYHLLAAGELKRVPNAAITVYKELLVECAKGEFEMQDYEAWSVYYDRTHKSKLKATAKDIRDLFIAKVDVSPHTFMQFANILLDHGSLEDRSGDVARRIMAPVANDDECVGFFVANSDRFSAILNKAGDDASNFRDALEEHMSQKAVDEEWIDFARAIGIDATGS